LRKKLRRGKSEKWVLPVAEKKENGPQLDHDFLLQGKGGAGKEKKRGKRGGEGGEKGGKEGLIGL